MTPILMLHAAHTGGPRWSRGVGFCNAAERAVGVRPGSFGGGGSGGGDSEVACLKVVLRAGHLCVLSYRHY